MRFMLITTAPPELKPSEEDGEKVRKGESEMVE